MEDAFVVASAVFAQCWLLPPFTKTQIAKSKQSISFGKSLRAKHLSSDSS